MRKDLRDAEQTRNQEQGRAFLTPARPFEFSADDDRADFVLVQATKRGDARAFTELVDRHYSTVYSIICRMCGSQDAADLTQEVFVRALRALRRFQFRGAASFRTWLYRIAVNIAINELRKRGRRNRLGTASLEEIQESETGLGERIAPDLSRAPDVIVEREELQRAVWHTLNQLSPMHRAVIVLVDLEGLAYEDVAQILGCPLGTVKSRLARARAAFARRFQAYLDGFEKVPDDVCRPRVDRWNGADK